MDKVHVPVKKPPSEEQDRIIIRLPDGLHARLKAAADETRQTMTQLAVSLMEQGLARYELNTNKITLKEKTADETLGALAEIINRSEDAIKAFQAYLLAEQKDD